MNFAYYYPHLAVACFGRGRDRKKRKSRKHLIRNALIGAGVLGVGGLGLAAILSRGRRVAPLRESEQLVESLEHIQAPRPSVSKPRPPVSKPTPPVSKPTPPRSRRASDISDTGSDQPSIFDDYKPSPW